MWRTFISIYLLILILKPSFSQTINFEKYRYEFVDTNKLYKYSKQSKSDSLLAIKYSKLYKRKGKIEYLYLLNNIANNYISEKQIIKAQHLLQNNIELSSKKANNTYESAYSNLLLCNTYIPSRNYKALAKFSSIFSEELLLLNVDSSLLCKALSISSKWNFASRNIEKGFIYFDYSNKIARKLDLIGILQTNYSNAGNILNFYEPQQASRFMDYAIYLSLSNTNNKPEDKVYLYLIAGSSYMAQNKFDEAIKRFVYALDLMEENNINIPRYENILHYYMASSYKYKHEYNKAIEQLEYIENKNLSIELKCDLYFRQEKYDTAKIFYEKYHPNIAQGIISGSNNTELYILKNLAYCNFKLGNIQEAKMQLRNCLFKMANDSVISDNKILPVNTPADNSSYIYWHSVMKNYTELVQYEYFNANSYTVEDVIDCYLRDIEALNNKIFIKKDQNSKFVLSSMAKVTSIRLLNFISRQDNLSDTILMKIWETSAFVKNNYLNSQFNKEGSRINLETIEQNKYDSLQTKYDYYKKKNINGTHYNLLAKELDCYKQMFVLSFNKKASFLYPSIDLKVDIKHSISKLNGNEAVIDYYSNDSNIFYFYYNNDGIKFYKTENTTELIKLIRQFQAAVKTGGIIDKDNHNSLYNSLGLSKVLKPSKVNSLYFITDNSLNTFPLEVLKQNNGKRIIESYKVNYLYSISQLNKTTEKKEYDNYISCFAPGFMGNNIYNTTILELDGNHKETSRSNKLAPLPFSINECKQIDSSFISKGLNSSLFINEDANTNNLFSELQNSRIIHIATHGKSSKHSINGTGIFLYDAKSNIDFLSFNMINNSLVHSDLIVLSACKTSEGKNISGEGNLSLPYGFIISGANSVIASLWNVSDLKSHELMMVFYKNILEHKMDYSTALNQAKIECMKRGFSSLDWGAFIIIGK